MSFTFTSNISAFKHESYELLRLAIPIFIGQLCVSCLGLVDSIMAADVGTIDLAAVALGATFTLPTTLFCLGFTYALAPIVAHLNGAKQTQEIPSVVFNSLLPTIISVIMAILFLLIVPRILLQNVEPELYQKANDYLFYIVLGLPATVLFNTLKNTAEGLALVKPSMIIGILSIFINIPVNYMFIYGKLGMPAMGAVGCGVATTIVSWFSLIAMFIYAQQNQILKPFKLFISKEPLNITHIKQVTKIGLPISIALIVETLTYCILGYAATPFGSEAVAAHQIINITCCVTFMIPLAMGNAIAIRISHSLGEGSIKRVKRATYSCLILSLIFIISCALTIYYNSNNIIAVFTDVPNVINIAAPIFFIVLLYQCQDPFFGTFQGVLRGFKDTKALMNLNIIIMWGLGIPFGYIIGFTNLFGGPYEIYGMWSVLGVCYYLMSICCIVRTIQLFKNINKYITLQ